VSYFSLVKIGAYLGYTATPFALAKLNLSRRSEILINMFLSVAYHHHASHCQGKQGHHDDGVPVWELVQVCPIMVTET
jgi:hypothetical protein